MVYIARRLRGGEKRWKENRKKCGGKKFSIHFHFSPLYSTGEGWGCCCDDIFSSFPPEIVRFLGLVAKSLRTHLPRFEFFLASPVVPLPLPLESLISFFFRIFPHHPFGLFPAFVGRRRRRGKPRRRHSTHMGERKGERGEQEKTLISENKREEESQSRTRFID